MHSYMKDKDMTTRANRFRFRAFDKRKGVFIDSASIAISGSGEPIEFGEGFCMNDDLIIMQSTGLVDKNGKEIFENDILEWEETTGGIWISTKRECVTWDSKTAWYRIGNRKIMHSIGETTLGYFTSPIGSDREYAVIGNIYEHPELLPTI